VWGIVANQNKKSGNLGIESPKERICRVRELALGKQKKRKIN